jgi:hypothetical protein
MATYLLIAGTHRSARAGLVSLGLAALAVAAAPVMADDSSEAPIGRTAVARPAAEWNKDGRPVRLDFDFGDFKAWARRDGSWNVEGTVQHRGLLCGTYTLSLRLGHGNPGCTDVQWFREPRAVASVSLCNSAAGILTGGNTEFRDVARVDEITCAERTISCSGNCN